LGILYADFASAKELASGVSASYQDGLICSREKWLPRPISPGGVRSGGLFPVAAAVGTGPDEAIAFAVLVVEEVGVDRSGEARIIQLQTEIVTALVRALGPGSSDLDLMRCTA